MTKPVLRDSISLLLSCSLLAFGCSDDTASTDGEGSESGSETADTSDSDETSDSDSTTQGDGDGDPATATDSMGDGDGDTGDGDGDTGDGDGDTGDGDGDTGDGDGDTGDGDGDPPVEEGAACGTIVSCVEDCGNDAPCVAACEDAGSPTGTEEYDALVQCVFDNNCNNNNCVETNCAAELFTCYTGEATCGESLSCSLMCAGDPVCETDCYYSANGLAQSQLEALGECAEFNACADQQCLEDNCPAELAGCAGGGADSLPCPIVSECLLDCGGDPNCALGCQPVEEQAQAEADALVACALENDCGDLECTEGACPAEFVECVSGEGSCTELFECAAACAGNELCEYNCVVQTGLMEQFVAGQLADCADQNGCAFDDVDCLMSNCGAESIACGF